MSFELSQRGKQLFISGNYVEALTYFTQALHCDDVSQEDKVKVHYNKAACFLKLGEFQSCITEADLCEFFIYIFLSKTFLFLGYL